MSTPTVLNVFDNCAFSFPLDHMLTHYHRVYLGFYSGVGDGANHVEPEIFVNLFKMVFHTHIPTFFISSGQNHLFNGGLQYRVLLLKLIRT